MTFQDPDVWWMDIDHTWCSKCGDYYGDTLYEQEHRGHDVDP